MTREYTHFFGPTFCQARVFDVFYAVSQGVLGSRVVGDRAVVLS